MDHLCGAGRSWRQSFRPSVRQRDAVRCCHCAPVPCTACSLPSVRVCSRLQGACWLISSIGAASKYIHPTIETCLRPLVHVRQTLHTARSRRLASDTFPLLPGVHWRWGWTPAHTPLIPTSLPQPLLRRQLQILFEVRRWLLPVYEIAETPSHASLPAIQPTTRFPKVRHGAQLAVDRSRRVPATVQRIARLLRAVLVLEPRVYVPDEVVVVVVAHY